MSIFWIPSSLPNFNSQLLYRFVYWYIEDTHFPLFSQYLYLLFSDDNLISLDEWVFNTEGHPLPIKGVNAFYRAAPGRGRPSGGAGQITGNAAAALANWPGLLGPAAWALWAFQGPPLGLAV